jgi:hypothetical protein
MASRNVISVSLTPEAIAELRSIAGEEETTTAAIGLKFIEEALRAKGRPVPEFRPFEIWRKRYQKDILPERPQAA